MLEVVNYDEDFEDSVIIAGLKITCYLSICIWSPSDLYLRAIVLEIYGFGYLNEPI